MSSALPTILLVTEHFPPAFGGSQVLFENIYSRIKDVPVTVLADDKFGPPGASTFKNMQVHRRLLRSPEWGIVRPAGLRHHVRVARSIRQLTPERRTIVHCGRALPEGVGALASGRPYVAWIHGEDLTGASQSRELTMITRLVLRRAKRVIANSRNTSRLLQSWGVEDGRIRVVYPAVDPERFVPSVDGRAVRDRLGSAGGPLLLSVGRLQRRKGHDLAISAVALLKDRLPGLKYVIVGDGDERASLERQIQEAGVAGHVVMAGEVSVADLPAYYAACDIFLLPNRIDRGDIEGFGIVFLEAAATAKPVVAGNTGGVPEAVADGITGLLVSGTDVQELADVIYRLASDASLRAALGDAGRKRVLEHFTWERAAAQVRDAHEMVSRELNL